MFGFGKKKKPPVYILLDRDSHILAKGDLQGELTDRNIQMKIVEGTADNVVKAEILQVVSSQSRDPLLMGQVIMRRGNLVVLEPMRKLGSEVRRSFRMPVKFSSFLYLAEGGRYAVTSIDLSCGGIAFLTDGVLNIGSVYEIVIPITADSPLIVHCQLLRTNSHDSGLLFYACKFVDIIDDEEALIQEAVFNVQLEAIRISKQVGRRGR